jgi:hypothetical protein
VAAFGQPYTFASGIAVDVANPEPYAPSIAAATAAGKVTGRAVVVTTTVTNGTSQPFKFNPFIVGPQATHAGQPAQYITDMKNNVGLFVGATILPGASFTYRTAFEVQPSKGTLQLEYKDGSTDSPAIFTGEV